MTYELLAAAAARADDLGPVVELTITVELRRWQAAEALGLLEAGQEEEAAAALADHALKAHAIGADGQALLWAGTLTVSFRSDVPQGPTRSDAGRVQDPAPILVTGPCGPHRWRPAAG